MLPSLSDDLNYTDASTAALLMIEPTYSKAFSEYYVEDFRHKPVNEYKIYNNVVSSILDEIATKRAEVVDRTPFDYYNDKVIDEPLKAIYSAIQRNPDTTRQFVEEAILLIQDMLESMDEKINILFPKKRKQR